MKHRFVLSLDQGTTSSRAILFDHQAAITQVAQKEHQQHYPEPGWVEHDADEIFQNQLGVAREVIKNAEISTEEIAAVGITNQRETTVVWDRSTGEPIGPAIVWQDRRTAEFCQTLEKRGHGTLFAERTGLRLDPYFSGTKLKWILDTVPEARNRAEAGELAFGTIDSWLIWKLTEGEVHATDLTNASRTLMARIDTGEWDDELLAILEVPRAMLPEIRSCSESYGEIRCKGLAGLPIAGVAGDQQAALFGQACFEPGLAKNTYGTGCFLLMNVGDQPVRSKNDLLTTVAWKLGERIEYALEGSVFIGGAVVQWLRDEMEIIENAEEVNELAASVEDSGGLYLVPAFSGLGAPHWDPKARGAAFGMTRGTNRAHFARAALEAIAYQVSDLLVAMEADAGTKLRELRVDGGASRSELLLAYQADLLAVDVVRPTCVETTALGAAFLAGLAVGFWKDPAEIVNRWQEDVRVSPSRSPEEMAPLVKGWRKAVERSRDWID